MVIFSIEPSSNGAQFTFQYMYSTNTVESSAQYYGSGNSIDRANSSASWGYVADTKSIISNAMGASGGVKNLYYMWLNNVGNTSERPVYFGNAVNISNQQVERTAGWITEPRTYTGMKIAISAGTISGDYQVFGVQN